MGDHSDKTLHNNDPGSCGNGLFLSCSRSIAGAARRIECTVQQHQSAFRFLFNDSDTKDTLS